MTIGGLVFKGRTFQPWTLKTGVLWAHIGCGCMIMGMAADNLGRQEKIVGLRVGETTQLGHYKIQLVEILYGQGSTYAIECAKLSVQKNREAPIFLFPEKRFYPSFQALIGKTALLLDKFSVVYVSFGGVLPDERWTLRCYYHPYILWIWIGALMIALGGLLAWRKHTKKG